MKWARVSVEGRSQYGLVDGTTVCLTSHRWMDVVRGRTPTIVGERPLAELKLQIPVPAPGKIVAIGLNYLDHCRETNTPPPKSPLIFTKFTTALADPESDIVWSRSLTNKVDFEAELAVVIGRRTRNVSVEHALECVFGYTAANDVSARDLQFGDGQWVRGKSLDTFCPLGPFLVTADELPNPQGLGIRSTLNGRIMQQSSTHEMIFGVDELVAFCSRSFRLEVGDIILTGTPHGVGLGRTPEVYMQDGDEIVVEIDGIGRLVNRCRVTE